MDNRADRYDRARKRLLQGPVSHLARLVCQPGGSGQKRVRDSDSVVSAPRIMANAVPFCMQRERTTISRSRPNLSADIGIQFSRSVSLSLALRIARIVVSWVRGWVARKSRNEALFLKDP